MDIANHNTIFRLDISKLINLKPAPIFGITKINSAALTLFYVKVWCIVLPSYDPKAKNKKHTEILNRAAREFRKRCALAGVKIGHGALLKSVLSRMYFGFEHGISDVHLTAELLGLFFDTPTEYHDLLAPYVQMKLKRCNQDYSWQLAVRMTGEK